MNARSILFASWYTGMGGGETSLLTLAKHLDRARYIPHLLLPHEGKLADAWRTLGLPVHILPYRGASTYFVPALWSRFPIAGAIARLIQREGIALVYSDYHTLPFVAGACRRTSTPYLWAVWGWWFKPKLWQRGFFRQQTTLAYSQSIRDGFLGVPPFMPPASVEVVYLGVDTARFHPQVDGASLRAELDIAPQTPIVSMIARFQSVKGHEVFQAMARRIAQARPDVRFIVAGEETFGVSADQAYRDRVLSQAEADPILRACLRYVGFRHDVERVMAMSDVVVCASDFESYGMAILEAMACAKPVVSTNNGGMRETVREGETGFLVAPRDDGALAERVLRLLDDPSLRARMGAQAHRRVQAHFSAQGISDGFMTRFDALLRL